VSPVFHRSAATPIDIEGQVDRFYRRLQARQDYIEERNVKEAARTSPERPLVELELGTRPLEALAKAGLTKVGDVLAKLSEGEAAILSIDGFGRKSLIDLKKKLRQLGYTLPSPTEEANV